MATAPNIVSVYPANGASGIAIGDSVTVTFDQEMDEDSINTGTFVLTGPDQGVFFGGEMNPFEEPGLNAEDILDSPYFPGFVQCSVSFSRVDASGATVLDSEVDYDGDGTLWRTVATLTPNAVLAPNKDYQALLAGDEDTTNAFDSGVRTRTVFDAEPIVLTGTGIIYGGGGFTGSTAITYVVEITSGGATGSATYSWWRLSDPFTVYTGITVTGKRELENGVYITCDPDGTFVTGDQWTIKCVPFLALAASYRWSFSSGSGSIIIPPSTSSVSGIDTLTSSVAGTTGVSTFSVSEVDPAGGEYGIAISSDIYTGERITITFTDTTPTDAATIVDNVAVRAEPAIGIDSINQITYTEELDFTVSLVGTTQLQIDLDPGQLYINNVVIVTLDKDIADTDGNTLGEEYITYFSTEYTPIYTSLRRIRLDLGPLVASVTDETIMFAILEASIYVDGISFVTVIPNATYFNLARRELTTCKAELILVKAIASDGTFTNRMSKQLGDLSVSRDGARDGLNDTINDLQDCIEYWKVAVQTGGEITPDASLKPDWTVKGRNASDAITVERQWESTNSLGSYRPSANTSAATNNSRRRLRTWRNSSWRRR